MAGDIEAIADQLTLTWIDTSAGELWFSVERSTGTTDTFGEISTTAETFGEISTTDPGVTTYTDLTVVDGTAYCYRIRAFDVTTYTSYSDLACATAAPLTVTLSLDETTFSSGDDLTLFADIHVNSNFSNPVDAYVDLHDPFGSIYPARSYVNATMPRVDFSAAATGTLPSLPTGTYRLSVVLVKAGGDPQNLADRLSNSASISFTLLGPDFHPLR